MVGRMTYQCIHDLELRTDEMFHKLTHPEHHHGNSPFCKYDLSMVFSLKSVKDVQWHTDWSYIYVTGNRNSHARWALSHNMKRARKLQTGKKCSVWFIYVQLNFEVCVKGHQIKHLSCNFWTSSCTVLTLCEIIEDAECCIDQMSRSRCLIVQT